MIVAIHAGSLGLLVNLNRSPPRNHITLVCVPGIRTVPLPKFGTIINKIKPAKMINSGHSAAINPSPNGSTISVPDKSGTSFTDKNYQTIEYLFCPIIHHV